MKNMLVTLVLIVSLASACAAQDANFDKTKFSSAKQAKDADVNLSVTDSQLSIKSRKGTAIDIHVPYASVDSMSYEYSRRHRVAEGVGVMEISPLTGVIVMFTKTTSHWLTIQYHDGTGAESVVLQLDKSQFRAAMSALESRTGKKISVADAKESASNPTVGSRDVDEVVPFGIDQVSAAMRPAMASVGCKVSKTKTAEIVCKRSRGGDERNGYGGESVTARLEASGEKTRVRITTGEGFVGRYGKKNWSTSIYQELLKTLQPSPAGNSVATTQK